MVVRGLLRKMNKAGLSENVGEDAVKITTKGLTEAPALAQDVTQYQRRQSELVEAFTLFVNARFPDRVELIDEAPARQLASYFERHAAPLLNEGLRGRKAATQGGSPGVDYLVASFVTHLAATDQTRFGYVVEAAKGAMLASVLLLDTSGLKESLSDLTLVLDTPVLMDALGFHGEIAERATGQLLALARAQSAQLVTFDHTVSELDGVLEHVAQAIRKGGRSRSTSAGFLHFTDIGASPADIALLQRKLPELLGGAEVTIVSRPDGYYEYGLDEGKLETLIQSRVNYFQDAARVNDVISLSSTHRLRKGKRDKTLEGCRAVLVSTNISLVRGAVEFDEGSRGFPLAIATDALASILWVRSPAAAPDVPREILLAAAFAGMQPNPNLWTRYLDEIERLEASQDLSADEAVILRTNRASRESLMDETLGDSDAVTPESPLAALRRVQAAATAPLEEQVRKLETRVAESSSAADSASEDWVIQVEARLGAEAALEDASAKIRELEMANRDRDHAEEARMRNIRARAVAVAHRRRTVVAWAVRIVGIAMLVWATVVFFTLPEPEGRSGVILMGSVGLVSLLLPLLPPLSRILDRFETRVSAREERRRLLDAGHIPPADTPR